MYILSPIVCRCSRWNFFMCSSLFVSFTLNIYYYFALSPASFIRMLYTLDASCEELSYGCNCLYFSFYMLSTKLVLCLHALYTVVTKRIIVYRHAIAKITRINTKQISPTSVIDAIYIYKYFSLIEKIKKDKEKKSKKSA